MEPSHAPAVPLPHHHRRWATLPRGGRRPLRGRPVPLLPRVLPHARLPLVRDLPAGRAAVRHGPSRPAGGGGLGPRTGGRNEPSLGSLTSLRPVTGGAGRQEAVRPHCTSVATTPPVRRGGRDRLRSLPATDPDSAITKWEPEAAASEG